MAQGRAISRRSEILRRVRGWIAVGLAAVVALISVAYLRDMKRSYGRVQGRSATIPSPYGDIEYVEGGSGPNVLVIHGAGGGYDQGGLIGQVVLSEQFRWIAPSRFGYLRSALPERATWDDQAHAYAYLLDHMGISEVAVVAMSQGGASALLFAALHPERVSSLTCLSCGVAASTAEAQSRADLKGRMLKAIFAYDLPYWAISKLLKRQLIGLMGASGTVIDRLTPQQRDTIGLFIDSMNPVAPRSAGAAFDNEATLPGDRIAAITAPALIVHARDDTLQLYHNAEFAASTIPGARLLRFERGGHILMCVEQAAIRGAVQEHILAHRGRTSSGSASPD